MVVSSGELLPGYFSDVTACKRPAKRTTMDTPKWLEDNFKGPIPR